MDRKAYKAAWYLANPEQAKARTSLRRKRSQRATPPWLTAEHRRTIKLIYLQAQQLSKKEGLLFHVDHIVPLRNPIVCGIHAPWNLQILSEADNVQKGNRVWPDQP